MLASVGECPVYYPGDEEVYLRAADLPDGGLFCALFNIGLDPIEQIKLVIDRPVGSIEQLDPSGAWRPVAYEKCEDLYSLAVPAHILDPVIIRIQ